jgi:predicted anti-sigma-YlaC factor YlaD
VIEADAVICQELVELATEYLEGVLDDRDLRLVEAHLDACDGCRAYLDQLRATIRLTGTLEGATLDPEAETKLLQAFRAWKNGS